MDNKKVKIKYLGKTPKIVELPIPFISRSQKRGEVICDPIGEFEEEDAAQLLAIEGAEGLFQLVEEEESEEDEKKPRPRPKAWLTRKKAQAYKDKMGIEGIVQQNKKGFWEIDETMTTVPVSTETEG